MPSIWSPNFWICSRDSVPTPCAQPGNRPEEQSSEYIVIVPGSVAIAHGT